MRAILLLAVVLLAGAFAAPRLSSAEASTDDKLFDQVRLAVARAAPASGGSLEIQVDGGVVTLRGYVRREQESQKAQRAAKKVKGVKRVINELKVDPDRGAGANRG
jgi:hyperosmotically inducible periplasmic protein